MLSLKTLHYDKNMQYYKKTLKVVEVKCESLK